MSWTTIAPVSLYCSIWVLLSMASSRGPEG
jgi:hypothetical protein